MSRTQLEALFYYFESKLGVLSVFRSENEANWIKVVVQRDVGIEAPKRSFLLTSFLTVYSHATD